MTHLPKIFAIFFMCEVGGKNSENLGLTADHHMATRPTPWTNQVYRGVQWDPIGIFVGGMLKDLGSRKNPTTIAEVGLAVISTSDRAQYVRGCFQFGHL